MVVGGGNVAFDILSVLTLSKHIFEPNTINQSFIEARDEYGSTHVVSVIRKMPWDLASDIHVLKEFFSLMKKSQVKVEVSGVVAPDHELSAEEQASWTSSSRTWTPRSPDSGPPPGRPWHPLALATRLTGSRARPRLKVAVRRGSTIRKSFRRTRSLGHGLPGRRQV